MLVWSNRVGLGIDRRYEVRASVMGRSGAWSASQALATTLRNPPYAVGAVNASGAAAVSWRRDAQGPTRRCRRSRATGRRRWRGACRSSAAAPAGRGPDGGEAALAAAADGTATLAWVTIDDGRSILWSSRFAGGAWTAPRGLDRGRADAWFGSVAAAPADAGVVVAWTRWVTRWKRVAVRMLSPGGASPRTLDTFDVPDIRGDTGVRTMPGPPPTRVVVGHAGPPVAIWDRLATREPVFASRLVASLDGGPAEGLSPGIVSGWPLAVGSADGRLVSAWADYVSSATGGLRILASERFG